MAKMGAELNESGKGSFITLTYDDESLPPGGSLRPRDVTLFIKSLREAIRPVKFRYYYAGEYGSKTERPHYHMCVFGLSEKTCINSKAFGTIVKEIWTHGLVHHGTLTMDSVGYVAGYVQKKKFFKNDPRLKGRKPEFSRMSRKPSLGTSIVPGVVRALRKKATTSVVEYKNLDRF